MKKLIKAGIALNLFFGAQSAFAACTFDIDVGDTLAFNKTVLEAEKSCGEITVNLKHTGNLPAAAMGHNWVLSETADVQAIATDGIPAGVAGNYLQEGDARVLAATPLIGGGESTNVTFSVTKIAAGEYTFFCSFPGHWGVMKGTFTLK